MKRYGVAGFAIVLGLAVVPATSRGAAAPISQENAERVCHEEAVRRLHVQSREVGTDPLRGGNAGSYRFKWYTDLSNGNNSSGTCEVDSRGRLARFDRDGAEGGGMGGGRRRETPVDDYPRVKIDTGGDGRFDGGRYRDIRLERAYLDTRGTPPRLALAGNNFRIVFSGEIVRLNNRREFTMRINRADHGDVQGRAEIRLNPDGNEIEAVNFRGRMDGTQLNSTFVRGR